MLNNIAIIIPSYNAKNTITQALKDIFLLLPKSKIIVVDDNSPDGTANEIIRYFAQDKRLKLIVREKKDGRGSAIIRGFQEGLKDKNTDYFVEMDADLCHEPKYIPLLVKKCKKYDIAIASKYLKTSQIIGLNKGRIFFSRLSNYFLEYMLKIPITDYTNGFRCYRRSALEKIILNSFFSKGFITLSEIAYKLHKEGCTFGEIPFVFIFNKSNKSNFNLEEIKEAISTILKMKFNFRQLRA
jgi:dolichol-phosphate mannosyltransferase